MTTPVTQDKIQVLQTDGSPHKSLVLPPEITLQEIYDSEQVPEFLKTALSSPVTWQVRNETSLRKAILSPQLAPQFIAALLALGTQAVFGDQQGDLADYLRRDLLHELSLMALYVPVDVAGQVSAENHVSRTPADTPIVSVRVVLTLADGVVSQAKIACTGAFKAHAKLADPADMLIGKKLTDALIDEVSQAMKTAVNPPDNFIGSEEYRREMAVVLTRRALQTCQSEVK